MVLSGTIGLTDDVDEKLKQLTKHFDYDSAKEMALFAYNCSQNKGNYSSKSFLRSESAFSKFSGKGHS